MALLNNIYIHVTDETVNKTVESTTHPVEKGIEISSTIRRKPITLSLTGMIVDYGDIKARDILSNVLKLQENGSLIDYRGRNVIRNLQIQSFNRSHPNTIHGGLSFTMELIERKFAQPSYTEAQSDQSEQIKEEKKELKVNPEIAVGDTVKFKGGYVYNKSNDTVSYGGIKGSCETTVLAIDKTAAHPYHIYSVDADTGTVVSGWVDKATLEGLGGTIIKPESKSSNQQVKTETATKLQEAYTVKKGDTLYDICNQFAKKFNVSNKEYSTFYEKFMAENKIAFSEAGNPRTLQAGARVTVSKNYYTDKLTQSNY